MAGLGPSRCRVKPIGDAFLAFLVRRMGGLRREVILEVLFDGGGHMCGHAVREAGGSRAIAGRYRPLFEHAFASRAAGFVLVHNHPSGDPRPSRDDIATTRSLAALARAMEFEFLDHLIIGGRAAMSMRRAGMMV